MSNSILSKCLVAAVLTLGLGVPQVADAALHFVPGAKCVVRSGPAAGYGTDASINNPGASVQILMCPGDTLDLLTDVAGRASVDDLTPADQVCCSVRTRNASGGIILTGTDACTSVAGTGNDIMLTPGNVGPVGGTFNYHWLQCGVPAVNGLSRSGVNAYRVNDI